MSAVNNIVTVSAQNLMRIISKSCYDKLVQRGKIRVLQRGCRNTPAQVEWNSVPPDLKVRYIREFGDPVKKAGLFKLRSYIETDYEAHAFFASWKLPNGNNIPEEEDNQKQTEYCTNAKILNAIRKALADRKGHIKTLQGDKAKIVWPQIVKEVKTLKKEMGHTLPTSSQRLREKLDKYVKDGYVSLIKDRYGNAFASKVQDMEQESVLRSIMRKHNNFDCEQIASLYNVVADKVEWGRITAQTVSNYAKKWDILVTSGRAGQREFDNTKAMLIKRSAPTHPLYYWTLDGWDAELLYQKTETDHDGNSVTTYHNRLTAVIVLDPCCKYPVGYAVGSHETPELIKAALRNAVNHTKELFGDRHTVLQVQSDNYGKKKMQSIYQAVGRHYTPARVGNAKAKVIEPWFNKINHDIFQYMPNWSGHGVTSKKSSQPNAEYLNKIRHSFPDEQGCRLQIETALEVKRSEAREAYLKAYREMPEQDKHIMSDEDFLYTFGQTTGFSNRLQASGLVVTIDGVKREYDCFDPKFRQYSYVDWTVKYDPADPSTALAMNHDGSLRFTVSEKYVQPMALKERTEEDSKQLKRVREHNQNLRQEVMDVMAEDQVVLSDFFLRNPQLEGTITKLVLIDSMGQHKDNKSSARLGNARKVLDKQSRKIERESEQSWAKQQEEYMESKVDINKYLSMP